MPIIIHAHQTIPEDLARDLPKLYIDYPEAPSIETTLTHIQDQISSGSTLYAGIFNQRWICSALVSNKSSAPEAIIDYIAVHPATRNRGSAQRLISEICRLLKTTQQTTEQLTTKTNNPALITALQKLGFEQNAESDKNTYTKQLAD